MFNAKDARRVSRVYLNKETKSTIRRMEEALRTCARAGLTKRRFDCEVMFSDVHCNKIAEHFSRHGYNVEWHIDEAFDHRIFEFDWSTAD